MHDLENLKMELADLPDDGEPAHMSTVRLRTTYWHDHKGLYAKRSLTFLKRRCSGRGADLLREECRNIGAAEIGKVLGLIDAKLEDGTYTVSVCNLHRDWETGIIDDYELALTPVKEEK